MAAAPALPSKCVRCSLHHLHLLRCHWREKRLRQSLLRCQTVLPALTEILHNVLRGNIRLPTLTRKFVRAEKKLAARLVDQSPKTKSTRRKLWESQKGGQLAAAILSTALPIIAELIRGKLL